MAYDSEVAALRALIDGMADTAPAPGFALVLSAGIARLRARQLDPRTAVLPPPPVGRPDGAERRRRARLARPWRPVALLRTVASRV